MPIDETDKENLFSLQYWHMRVYSGYLNSKIVCVTLISTLIIISSGQINWFEINMTVKLLEFTYKKTLRKLTVDETIMKLIRITNNSIHFNSTFAIGWNFTVLHSTVHTHSLLTSRACGIRCTRDQIGNNKIRTRSRIYSQNVRLPD